MIGPAHRGDNIEDMVVVIGVVSGFIIAQHDISHNMLASEIYG